MQAEEKGPEDVGVKNNDRRERERDERVEYTALHCTPKQQRDSSNYTTAT